MIYLDFAKAFDKVDHNILLHKVKAIGIQGKLGIWIKNFLSNRTQHVRLPGGHCSSVISGVPQGTVLGLVLFFILMSDISKDINCNIISFADDTRLCSAINSPADCDSFRGAKLGKIQGGCRFDKAGVTKYLKFLRDKNINFLEFLR